MCESALGWMRVVRCSWTTLNYLLYMHSCVFSCIPVPSHDASVLSCNPRALQWCIQVHSHTSHCSSQCTPMQVHSLTSKLELSLFSFSRKLSQPSSSCVTRQYFFVIRMHTQNVCGERARKNQLVECSPLWGECEQTPPACCLYGKTKVTHSWKTSVVPHHIQCSPFI